VAINPNFPLGFICSEKQQIDFIKFCERNSLVLISIEGLQNTILNKEKKFHSMRSIVSKLNSKLEVISLNTISYGHFFQFETFLFKNYILYLFFNYVKVVVFKQGY